MFLRFLNLLPLREMEMGGGSDVPLQADTHTPMDQIGTDTKTPDLPRQELPQDKPVETPKPTLEEDLDKIWTESHKPADERQNGRDEQGRFKARTDPEADNAEGNDHPAENGSEETDLQQATVEMPRSWSKEQAEVWNALTPAAQKIVSERETAMTQALSRAGRAVNTLRNVEPVLQAVEPYRDYLHQLGEATGKAPASLISDVLRFENTLRTAPDNDTKLSVIADIIAEYGVDLTPVFGEQGHEAVARRQPVHDPRVEQLAETVEQLAAERRYAAQREQAALQQDLGSAIQAVESNAKDFPHYATVRSYMAAIIPQIEDTGQPTIELLREAYRIAVHAHPTTAQRIQQDQQRTAEQAARDRIAGRTQQARRAASANVRSGVPSIPKRSVQDDLNSVADKYYK